jgi:very-short-patch-repair endonuclease/predicted transcriptional regulator of viral defense system
MTDPERAYPRKPPRGIPSSGHKLAGSAYVAKIVSLAEIQGHKRAWRRCEEVAEWLASRQLGLVTSEQLQVAGIHRSTVGRRALSGFLHRLYRGVYLVGHSVPLPGALELGAVLACGSRTYVSHRSAAGLWAMTAGPAERVTVTVVRRWCDSRDNLHVHATDRLDALDRRVLRGIPLTAPARTLVDFAADAEDDELEAAVSEARALRLIRDGELEAALDRAGIRAGVARMRWLLSVEGDQGYTKSKAERVMRKLARDAGLAQPLCNAPLHGYEVDFLWAEQRLVVEVDGYQFHGHRSAFERDRRKDQVLIAAGYRVVRVTWLQLIHEPMRVAAVIAGALTASRVPG